MPASIEPATVHLQILVVIPDFPRHQDAPLFQELIVATDARLDRIRRDAVLREVLIQGALVSDAAALQVSAAALFQYVGQVFFGRRILDRRAYLRLDVRHVGYLVVFFLGLVVLFEEILREYMVLLARSHDQILHAHVG